MTLSSASNRSRQLKNSIARWGITLGGISVLFTLVLIFMYLLYVIKPIFEAAEIKPSTTISLSNNSSNVQVLTTGVDELKEIIYQLDDSGQFSFYRLITSNDEEPLLSKGLIEDDRQLIEVINAQGDSTD